MKPLSPLSEREIQVLRLVAEGHVNHAIGRMLYLSEDTIKSHLVNAYKKLGAVSRAAAVARGYELGVLGSESVPEDESTEAWFEARLAKAKRDAVRADRQFRKVPWATGAGSRALWRLADLHPELFRELVAEEMASDDAQDVAA